MEYVTRPLTELRANRDLRRRLIRHFLPLGLASAVVLLLFHDASALRLRRAGGHLHRHVPEGLSRRPSRTAGTMIGHHTGAIRMAELAKEKAGHEEVKRLAGDIIAVQRRENGIN